MIPLPLISVIVPVYRAEEFLERAVKSIVCQSYGNLEIILVDDGSPDHCPAICDQWAQKDPRIHVIHKENGGASSARNAGLKLASGEWISFIDADDWVHPRYFEILIAQVKNTQATVISAFLIRTANEPEPVDARLDTLSAVYIPPEKYGRWKNRFYVCGKLYSHSVLKDMAFDESVFYGEDVVFNILLLYRPDVRVFEIPVVLYFYFIHSGSLVSSNRPMKRVRLCNVALSYAEEEINEDRKAAFIQYAMKRSLSTRFDLRGQSGCQRLKQQCDEIIAKGLCAYQGGRGS